MTIQTEPIPKDRSDHLEPDLRRYLRLMIKNLATYDATEGDTKDVLKQGVFVHGNKVLHSMILAAHPGAYWETSGQQLPPTLSIDVFTTKGDYVESIDIVDNDDDFISVTKAGKDINDEQDFDDPKAIDRYINRFLHRYGLNIGALGKIVDETVLVERAA